MSTAFEPMTPRIPFMDRVPRPRVAAACDYCGSSDAMPFSDWLVDDKEQEALPPAFRGERFRFVRCQQCGLVYLPDRPDIADLDVYYSDSYMCFQKYEDRGRIFSWLADRVARGKLKQIHRYLPAGNHTLLDYGCGSGTWMTQLKRLAPDLDMIGAHVVDGPLEDVRSVGIPAYCCDETTLFDHIAPGSIGVIHLFHVIEHVPSPLRVFERLREALAPGGVIIGQTPNIDSWGRRYWGRRWNQWHAPHHLVLFDHNTIRRHAERAGLETVQIKSSLSSATQWAQAYLHQAAERKGRAFRSIGEPLYPYLIFAFLPFTVCEALLAHTCHMDFVFRRPLDG